MIFLTAASFDGFAVILWVIQFFQKLQYNVMSREDLDNRWSSENMASLGYSFWFVPLTFLPEQLLFFQITLIKLKLLQ